MSEKSRNQIEFELLLKYGYRPDQLIPRANGSGFDCSLDDISAAIALVQNPYHLEITDKMKESIRQLVTSGDKPHTLLIFSSGNVSLDFERVDNDMEEIMWVELLGPK
jgi:hypothetical protein